MVGGQAGEAGEEGTDPGIGEQGHTSKDVMEHIGLFEVIELFGFAEPGGGAEALVLHLFKEVGIVDEAGYGIEGPAGEACEALVDMGELGNDGVVHAEQGEGVVKIPVSAPVYRGHLAGVQAGPGILVRGRIGGVVLCKHKAVW